VTGGPSAAGASRSSGGVLRTPRPGSPDFREAVEAHLAAHPGATVLPASDAVLVALDLPGAHLVDKAVLSKLATAAGLSVPPTREFAGSGALLEEAPDLEYPLVVKAAVKTRTGEDARRVDSAEELDAAVARMSGPVVVQPFATGAMRAVSGVIADGELRAVVHQRYVRIWPPDCGTASAAVTTEPDHDLEARLPHLLAGHTGVFQVQLVGDQVIDVNPRVYGSLPLAVAAGANLPAIACGVTAGDTGTGLVRGRPGVRYRWLEGDLRRVLDDVRRGSLGVRDAGRALRPHRGTAHSVESLRDPGPAVVRVLDVARRRLS
jgi:predicted ATP-grasp superfamily ATP-dependent carboligase